jgi:hypothetical protein
MRQHLAKLLFSSTLLSGCSLIYDTSELPRIDAPPPDQPIDAPPPDMPFDANVTMFSLTGAAPSVLVEGQGDGGSRKAVLVLTGESFAMSASPMVSLSAVPSADDAAPPPPAFNATVHNDQIVVSGDGTLLAVPVTLAVDETATDTLPLVITLVQTGPDGPITRVLSDAVSLRRLPELNDGDPLLASGFPGAERVFSKVSLTAGTIKGVTPASAEPVLIRSTSSITVAGAATINVNAPNVNSSGTDRKLPGPAGGSGGVGGGALGGNGGPGTGPTMSGEGANGGFIGDTPLKSMTSLSNNRSSGGGGGSGALGGGDGGGGGGSIKLLADGDLTIPGATARGAAGVNGGGSGSGGFVLLRAGGALSVAGAVNVSGGTTAAAGRARFDAGGTASYGGGVAYRGPAFVAAPAIVTSARPTLQVIGEASASIGYYLEGGGLPPTAILTAVLGAGPTGLTLGADLQPGLNQVCLLVDGAERTSDTKNCIDLAYVPAP